MTDLSITDAPNDLKKFLDLFDYTLITVNVRPEPDLPDAKVQPGKWFSEYNKVRAVPQETFFSQRFQGELHNNQQNGCAIWFTINEGDGQPAPDAKPGVLNCGKRENIQKLKTLAIDTDNADAKALIAKLAEIKLHPHAIIETSPGKYHFYFLIDSTPATGENILHWKALQKYLSKLVPNLDISMTDINQVLRLPSFYNQKPTLKEPFRIKITRISNHPHYNLKFLFDRLEAYPYLDTLLNGNGHHGSHYTKFEFPESSYSVEEGARRTSITRYMEHLMENVLPLTAPEQDYWIMIDGFINKYLKKEHQADFLEGGSRRKNITDYFNQQRERRIFLRQQEESRKALQEFDHLESIEANQLPDDFYLNFPGDLGMLTNTIHEYAPHLTLEMCFAGALCISGALKAETFRYNGFWPMVNGMIVAGPGAGKSTLKGIIETILSHAGLMGRFPHIIDFTKTVQALHLKLYEAGGVGTTIVDEAGEYLSSITSKNAPVYMQDLKKYYKEATTGSSDGTRLSPGTSVSGNYPPITHGFLSVWMLIQPEKFKGTLSLEDMSDGFLPRFMVFRGRAHFDIASVALDSTMNKPFEPSTHLKVWLEQHAQLLPFASDASLAATLEEARRQVLAQGVRGRPDGAIREAQREAVYRVRSEARLLSPKVEVTLSEDARAALAAYTVEMQKKAMVVKSTSPDDTDPRLAIYARVAEMICRLIACSATLHQGRALVDLPQMEHIIRFHRFQTERFFTNELAEMNSDRDLENVLKAVAKAVRKNDGQSATVKEIRLCIHSSMRPRNFDAVLREAARHGLIWEEQRPHLKAKDKKVTVYRPAQSETGPELH